MNMPAEGGGGGTTGGRRQQQLARDGGYGGHLAMGSDGDRPKEKAKALWGQVRATPSGACLGRRRVGSAGGGDEETEGGNVDDAGAWHSWRSRHLDPLPHPSPGFGRVVHPSSCSSSRRRGWGSTSSSSTLRLQDKWRLVPECLQLRSLLKQHIQSYDHFVSTELRQIVVNTPANSTIKSDCDPKFFLSYRDVWVGSSPSVDEDSFYTTLLTPQLCRWRDLTYSSPLYATIRYTRGNHVVEKRGVLIGRIPVMVRSRYCALSTTTPRAAQQQQQQHQQHPNGSERNPPLMSMSTIPKRSGGIMSESDRMEGLKECPYDPGGYFIVKGVEKAILIQEQLSKNRVIIETTASSSDGGATVGDGASNVGPGASSSSGGAVITASITSSTHERKSKSYLIWKHGRVYLKNNTLGEDVPVVIVLKALGMQSDYELVSWVAGSTTTTTTPSSSTSTLRSDEGQDEEQDAEEEECDSSQLVSALALSLEDAQRHSIYTQHQALRFIGNRVRGGGRGSGYSGTNPSPATGPGASAAAAAQQQQPSAAASFTSPRRQPSPEEEARDVLAHVVLSHVPVVNYDFRAKAIYVCNIVRRLLLVHLGHVNVDDKDYYGNKRLELAGNLLSLLFEDLFKLFNKDLKRQADLVLSKPNRAMAFDVIKTIRPDTITNGMVNAIATGNWVLKRFRMDRAGVTQVVSRLSYLSALGMMTRINSQFEKTRKVSGPRSLQPSQWGMLCPADTPEGEACGLVKNLALLAHITTDETDTMPIERLCFDLGVEDACRLSGLDVHQKNGRAVGTSSPFSTASGGGYYVVFLNGNILGVHQRPRVLVNNLRKLRRRGLTGEFVSVYLHEGQRAVHLATDGGRVCRPLIIVDHDSGRPKLEQSHIEALVMKVLTMRDLLRQGIVEYVDCNEENNTLIAVTEKDLEIAIEQGLDNVRMRFTHLEIDPFTILGVVGGVIPFPHHNQSPRNTYTVAMAKQAIGTVALNQYERFDGLIYTLVYPQKPLVKSRTLDLVNFDNIPGGQNASIAVMSYSGYDIEDSIILNKASIDRGFGRCMVLRKHQTSIRRYPNGTNDKTCAPPDPSNFQYGESDKRYAKYSALDSDGICRVGEKLEPGSIICNKESPVDTTTNTLSVDLEGGLLGGGEGGVTLLQPQNVLYKPSSLSYRGGAPSHVDKVLITSNDSEPFLIKVVLRQVRRPEVGDKFASRHGQKGVCGLIVREEDMPFNEYGHVPDLIMNPHGFPSRMTVGKLLELLVGKAGLMEGRQAYASAFGEELGSADTAESASEALIRSGLNYAGKDVFYSGTNGEPLDAYVFSGPVFYQKLKHMVLDKAHARARGPRAVLTRQPTEGRSRDGGLRLGEMERDCLIAYGASNLIMERLMHSSDAFSASVCLTCGLLQYQNWCQYCRSGEHVADIRLPYACKLLFQELQSMNVLPRLRLKDYT